MNELNPIERAFELARSGECKDILDLERRLKRDGYASVSQHLGAPSLRKQLSTMIKQNQIRAEAAE